MSEDKLVDKRIVRSTTALKNALIALLKRKPLESLSVRDIIEQAGYSRATFYTYYKNKEDFIESVLQEEIQNYVDIIFNSINSRNGIIIGDSVYEPAVNFMNYVYENRDLYRLILGSNFQDHTLDNFCETAFDKFIKMIDIEMFETLPSLDLEFYFYSYTYLYMVFIKYWIKNDFKYSPQYMAEQVTFLLHKKVHKVMPKKKKT